MEKGKLRLGKGKEWKIVSTLNEYNNTLEVTKEDFRKYKSRVGEFSELDDLLNFARLMNITQVEITYNQENEEKLDKLEVLKE